MPLLAAIDWNKIVQLSGHVAFITFLDRMQRQHGR
jgi:hypothetical protein